MLSIASRARGSSFRLCGARLSSSRPGYVTMVEVPPERAYEATSSPHLLLRLLHGRHRGRRGISPASSRLSCASSPAHTAVTPALVAEGAQVRPLQTLWHRNRPRWTAAAAAAAAMTSCRRRGLSSSSSSPNGIQSVDAHDAGVEVRDAGSGSGDDDTAVGVGGVGDADGAVVGGVGEAAAWEDVPREPEESGVSGLSGGFGSSEESDVLDTDLEEEEEDNDEDASHADESLAVQSAMTVAENEGGVESSSSSPKSRVRHPSMMRLSRRIARSGVASRREAERLIEEGVVSVNGTIVQSPALNVGPRDVVKVKGKALEKRENHTPEMWMVHKTRNELVTRNDPDGRPTVFDRLARLKLPDTLIPVGRLDYNTEGLLLLTNDGDLARQMELPSSNIVRTYSVRVYGNITEEKLRAMRSGCTIDGVRYKGMFVRVEGGGGKGREGRNAWLTIECTEGKNRQIRKICKYLCLTVNRLARTHYGPFSLGKVRSGGVARVEIPKAFLRRLEDGTAGGGQGRGKRRVGPGPGTGKRREAEAGGAPSSSPQTASAARDGEVVPSGAPSGAVGGGDGGTRGTTHGGGAFSSGRREIDGRLLGPRGAQRGGGGKRGHRERIRKGVAAPMSRGDRSALGGARQRARRN